MAIRRNSVVNVAGSLVGLALFAVLTPLYFHVIGSERYGILAILWAFLAFFSAFDFGMGAALSYLIATNRRAPVAEQANYFWTGLTISLPFGVIAGGLLFAMVGGGFGNLFKLTDTVRVEMLQSTPALFAIGICTVLSSTMGGLLRGREKFVVSALLGALSLALSIILPVLAAILISPSLNVLILATLASRVLLVVLAMGYTQFVILANTMPRISIRSARALVNYGAWATFSGIVELAISGADRFVLGAVAGSAAVAFYAVPSSILSRVLVFPNSLGGAALPQTASRSVAEEAILARKIIKMTGMLTPCFVIGVFLTEPFLRLWLGASFAKVGTFPMQVLLPAYWMESIAAILYFRVLGLGKPRLNLLAALIVIGPYVGLMYYFSSLWGVAGAATAYCCRNVLYLSLRTTFTRSWRLVIDCLAPEFLTLLAAVAVCALARPAQPPIIAGVVLSAISIWLAIVRRPAEVNHVLRDMSATVERLLGRMTRARG